MADLLVNFKLPSKEDLLLDFPNSGRRHSFPRQNSPMNAVTRADPIKKSVHFSETSLLCAFKPSKNEDFEKWYSNEDQMRFKRERLEDIAQIRQKLSEMQKETHEILGDISCREIAICCTGIERKVSNDTLICVVSNLKRHKKAVLAEQAWQRQMNTADAASLSRISRRHSKAERQRARFIAVKSLKI